MFKHKMIRKMIGPDAISATALSKQVDVPQATLSAWLRKAGIDSSLVYPNPLNGNMPMVPKTPNDWNAEEKLKAVLEASSLSDDQLGAFLRSKGVHETHLEQRRTLMLGGLDNGRAARKPPRRNVDVKRIRSLEKELSRNDLGTGHGRVGQFEAERVAASELTQKNPIVGDVVSPI
jgi:transposase-like protein